MTRKKTTSDAVTRPKSLRERAEELLHAKAVDLPTLATRDVQALVHELCVYQIELEIQNEELCQAQVELSQSRDRYSDLYEYAPVGYLTLNKDGGIIEANITAATMLGVDRQNLAQANITQFIARHSQDDFYRHRQAMAADDTKQICELDMHRVDGTSLIMQLESIPFDTAIDRQFWTALIDITSRKQAERRLEEQELFNRSTLDALSAHVAVIDATGQIVATNLAWRNSAQANQTSWQCVREELNYITVCDRAAAVGDADAAEAARSLRQIIAGEQATWTHEYACHSADEQRWLYCRMTRFPGDGAVYVVVAHDDMTAMHQAQEQLAAANVRFKALERVSPFGIIFFDRMGKCVDVNAPWCEMSEIGRQAALGDNWSSAVHPDDRSRISSGWSKAVRDGASFHAEFRLLHSDGKILWVVSQGIPIRDANGAISGFIRVSIDVTLLKQTERELKVSSEQLSTLLKTAADAVITIDELGIVQSINQAAERMFGYADKEVIGQNVRILMPSPYYEEHDGYLKRYRETGVKRIIGIRREVTGLRKDGTTFPLDLSVSAIDHLNLYMGLLRDISQRKQLERQVVEIASLEQQRIGQDLHDSIGQQLTGMILLAKVLAESARQVEPPDKVSVASERAVPAQRLSAQAERLREGLQDALKDIRTISRELTPVPINQDGLVVALEQLAATVSSQSSLTCHFYCSAQLDPLDNVTATHLFNITQGALSNALRHARASEIQIRLEQSETHLVLSVRDDGMGLPPTSVDGLGLRIMRNRAQIIDGILAIRAIHPTGTEVSCTVVRRWHQPVANAKIDTLNKSCSAKNPIE